MRDTEILLIRHPETVANVTGRLVGRGDAAFTYEGRLQMRRVPRKVKAYEPDVVWTSPLRRAYILARASAAHAGVDLRVDERLIELDFGTAEGMTHEEIAEAAIPFNFRSREEPVAPEGESRGEIERRSARFCDDLVAEGGRHVVVTHGGVLRASLVHLLGLHSTDIWAFHIHNAQLAYVRVIEGHGILEEYVRG